MSNPNGTHPYTDKPNHHYMTVVFEQVSDGKGQADAIFDSLSNGTPCSFMPDYKVTALGIGDEISEQEACEEAERE